MPKLMEACQSPAQNINDELQLDLFGLNEQKIMNPLEPLSKYGLMAEEHWRKYLPKMVAELEAAGKLRASLFRAQLNTMDDMDIISSRAIQLGYTPEEAREIAWDLVRERYIFLPPET